MPWYSGAILNAMKEYLRRLMGIIYPTKGINKVDGIKKDPEFTKRCPR